LCFHRAGRVDVQRVAGRVPGAELRPVPKPYVPVGPVGGRVVIDVGGVRPLLVTVAPDHPLQRLERGVLAVLVDPALQGRRSQRRRQRRRSPRPRRPASGAPPARLRARRRSRAAPDGIGATPASVACCRDTKTPRNIAPRPDGRPDNAPVPGRGPVCLTAHEPRSTLRLEEKVRLKYLCSDPIGFSP
jgi:hypothetical protein